MGRLAKLQVMTELESELTPVNNIPQSSRSNVVCRYSKMLIRSQMMDLVLWKIEVKTYTAEDDFKKLFRIITCFFTLFKNDFCILISLYNECNAFNLPNISSISIM